MSKHAKQVKRPQHIGWRFQLVLAVVCLVFLVLVGRAAYIQVVKPEMLQHQGDLRSLRSKEQAVYRGLILDRNGVELAVSVPVQTVWADPKEIAQRQALELTSHWQALAEVLATNKKQLIERVSRNPKKRFVYLQRQVTPSVAEYIRELKIPGVYLKQESKRFYPSGEITAQLVGFTNIDDKGIEGIERQYDRQLQGDPGKVKYVKDAKGRRIEVLDRQASIKPENVQLSIDQRIQAVTYKAVKAAVKSFQASSGAAVVIDVETSEVLALVNSPSFNPNNRRGLSPHRIRNRAIADTFEPGSTVKPLVVLESLEFGAVSPGSVIDTSPGWMRLGGRLFEDAVNYGELDMTGVLRKSSNVGVAKLALGLPKEYFLNGYYDAGFGEDTGIGLAGESMGILAEQRRWSESELAALSRGYGMTSTTLQLASVYTTLANGGVKRPLSILKLAQPYPGERVFSERNTRAVLEMMESVTEKGGTGTKAHVPGYRVAGKTGTARKAVAGGYGDDYVGVFAGIAPVSNPRIAVAVMINEPANDLYHGGDVAAPVFSSIVSEALPLLNVVPDAKTRLASNKKGGRHDS